jgi:hypothetical protein
MNRTKFWRALERLSSGAVMLQWQRELGPELDRARVFLQLAKEPAETYPCTNPAGCGCPHRIEEDGHGGGVAVFDTDEWCPPIPVKSEDRQVFRADARRLCDGIARALALATPTARKSTRARAERVGIYEAANAEVFLMIPADTAWMAREAERLFGAQPEPFMLLTPTGVHCSAEVESMLRRQGSVHIPLARFVSLGDNGKLTASPAIKPVGSVHEVPRPSDGRGCPQVR